MLRVSGRSFKNCDGMSRRNFVQLGVPLLGLSLSQMLQLESRTVECINLLLPRRLVSS